MPLLFGCQFCCPLMCVVQPVYPNFRSLSSSHSGSTDAVHCLPCVFDVCLCVVNACPCWCDIIIYTITAVLVQPAVRVIYNYSQACTAGGESNLHNYSHICTAGCESNLHNYSHICTSFCGSNLHNYSHTCTADSESNLHNYSQNCTLTACCEKITHFQPYLYSRL